METIELTINDVVTTLTLDDVWGYCVSMYRWVSEQEGAVDNLKRQWLTNHGFDPYEIAGLCFFCEWETSTGPGPDTVCAETCPAVQIDPRFNCCRRGFHYRDNKVKFYNEINKLNNIRKNNLL